MRILRYLFLVCFIFTPLFSASAQVVITEIMYAPEEGVAHEWFEIFNNGDNEIDLRDWRFNDGSNHIFEEPPKNGGQGSLVISQGAYAVIAKEASTFLSSHQSFSGTIIDGSFSLTDSGDALSLIDANGATVDTVAYGENAGAQKNGLSLQKVGGAWVARAPTPGAVNAGSTVSSASNSSESGNLSNTSGGSQTSSNTGGGGSLVEQTIFPNAGPDKTVIAGGNVIFEGEALGVKKEPLLSAHFVWNFGDGEVAEGKKVIHTYRYPGEHIVVLNVASDERSVSDKAVVTVTESKVSISGVISGEDGYIEITNGSLNEIDISWWQISDSLKVFIIPSGTLVLPSKKVRFVNLITKLAPNNKEDAVLYYPSGKVAYQYSNSKLTPLAPILVPASSEHKVAIASVVRKPVEESGEFKNNEQAASAAEAAPSLGDKSENLKWYLALVGLVVLALVGVVFLGKRKKEASGFTIVE